MASWPELLTHAEFPVDVVLLDLDLKDNIPISLKLSTLKTTGVATVLMSTYSEPAVVREALAAGAMGYLVKSEDAEMIVEAIRAARTGQSCISAEPDQSYLKRIREKYRVAGYDVGTKVALRKRAIQDGILLQTD